MIEFYDTISRYMFVLELYFLETSLNALDLFTRFLLYGPFPKKRIRLRPDRAKGFLNLKRPIHELNIKYSLPGGFYLEPDFAGRKSPKHKVHLESSHRSVHHFEIRIIKEFEDKIVGTEAGWAFKGNKKEPIVVTCLDIGLEQLRQSRMLELYRREHNDSVHRFSEGGKTLKWVPSEKLQAYLADEQTMEFDPDHIQGFIRYPIIVEDFIAEYKNFSAEAIEQIYAATDGDMRKFEEICMECQDKAKELKYSLVDINLAITVLTDLPSDH